jgi:hypothetical protein
MMPDGGPKSMLRAQDTCWGMVDETLIDPAGLVKGKLPYEAYEEVFGTVRAWKDDQD